MPTEFELGVLVGLLVGEGHFGGDGRQPQVTLRMHVRHEAIFRWLLDTFPGGRLYGPYDHSGRRYFQWMARGAFLRDELLPLLEPLMSPELDAHSYERFHQMRLRYARQLGLLVSAPVEDLDIPADRARAAGSGPGQAAFPEEPAPARSVESIFAELRLGEETTAPDPVPGV